MKNVFSVLMIAALAFIGFNANAQCSISDTLSEPGLDPLPEDVGCFVAGDPINLVFQFKNFDTVTVGGANLVIEYIIFEEIENLPCGIKWTTSKQNAAVPHKFATREAGCIRFLGTTSDPAGEYELTIRVKAKVVGVATELPYTAADAGLAVSVRVIANSGDVCDTLGSPNWTAQTASCPGGDTVLLAGINTIESIDRFSLYPNPVSGTANISFVSAERGEYTASVVNIVGQEVSRENVTINVGLNQSTVDVSALPTGVYMYNLTNGKSTFTSRFVVE